jgi:predicted lipoprotein with Yx(FWY)xxD motif
MNASSVRRTQGRRRGAVLAAPALIAAAVLSLTACGSAGTSSSGGSAYGNASASPSKATTPANSGEALAVRQTSLGTILTDGEGFTLYGFDADKGTTSACSGACATAWPPATVKEASPKVGTGVTQSLVGESTRSDGTTQLTYASHPLYRFEGDSKPGETNGDGSTAFGARWDALTPTGKDATGGS